MTRQAVEKLNASLTEMIAGEPLGYIGDNLARLADVQDYLREDGQLD